MQTREQESAAGAEDRTSTLVSRLREGNSEAGALLDELYRDALVRFCWGYLGRVEEAEDAAQDICYKVLTAKGVPDGLRPWLYKIARNHCLNVLRYRARHREDVELPVASHLDELLTGHLTRLVQKEQRDHVGELVRSLPESQREVLRLRYVEDLTRAEIAVVLEIAESLVKSRLFEGLKRLRELIALPEDD
jgi:RNA polymerase sigma-70 factor (ECF subfamily)